MLKPLSCWALVATALAVVACEVAPQARTPADNALNPALPQGWVLGKSLEEEGRRKVQAWVPAGQTVEDWGQLITLNSWSAEHLGPTNLRAVLADRRQQTDRSCPGQVEWRVLEDRGDSLVYEMVAEACLGFAAHHQIGRLLLEDTQRYELSYARKGGPMSKGQRRTWLDWIHRSQTAVR